MSRAICYLGLLVSSTLALAVMTAPGAWAADRYGPAGGYDRQEDYGRTGAEGRAEDVEDVDPCAVQARLTGHGCLARDAGEGRGERYDRQRFSQRVDDVEEIDPCAIQGRLAGRGCPPVGGGDRRYGRVDEQRFSARGDDIEDVDPCATQARLTGRGCVTERFEADRGGRAAYQDRSSWRIERGYETRGERHDRFADEDGSVDACEVVHERLGDQCPYARYDRVVRPIWVEERLPDSFFISEGGVGGGIVDFGSGGGGGGGFAFAEGSANANSSASASVSASASANVSVSIMAHNHHMMMMHYPPKMMHGGGCGCKKGHW